eukprot:COSAG01_NODE_10890_length_2059_cov_2.313265_2_plen_136_part_00
MYQNGPLRPGVVHESREQVWGGFGGEGEGEGEAAEQGARSFWTKVSEQEEVMDGVGGAEGGVRASGGRADQEEEEEEELGFQGDGGYGAEEMMTMSSAQAITVTLGKMASQLDVLTQTMVSLEGRLAAVEVAAAP